MVFVSGEAYFHVMALSIPAPGPAAPLALATVAVKRRREFSLANTCSLDAAARFAVAKSDAAIDRALVRRFNQGDEGAFGEIVARHRERIQALAERLLRNHADAEETAQDTFIRAHRGLGRFRGDSSLATWLYRITCNLARNRYWFFHRRGRHLTRSLDSTLTADTHSTLGDLIASAEPDPARRVATQEFVALAASCMLQLGAGAREILTLRMELHRTYEEIACALGLNEGTVKSRMARARGQLRQLMTLACPEYAGEPNAHAWFEPGRPLPSASSGPTR